VENNDIRTVEELEEETFVTIESDPAEIEKMNAKIEYSDEEILLEGCKWLTEEEGIERLRKRITFNEFERRTDFPDLLHIQLDAFNDFMQEHTPPTMRKMSGLHASFVNNFPIEDASSIFQLEYIDYTVEKPKYTEEECRERELTFAKPLKARLRLLSKADKDSEDWIDPVEHEVYLGNIPSMTDRGTFIINGAERVIVTQIHRSPGVFFDNALHPNGTRIYTARIIPFRGSWMEFTTDIHDVMYAYIDRKKKFPLTALLRAIGFSSDEDILELFNLCEIIKGSELNDEHIGRKIASDVIDLNTGEIIATRDMTIDEPILAMFNETEITDVKLYEYKELNDEPVIARTLTKDPSRNREEALELIYRQLRSSDPPDLETAEALLDKLFFNPKRYDLGLVGRTRINEKMGLDIPLEETTLTTQDIVSIMKRVLNLHRNMLAGDDIDHLGNRRIRTVGEQLTQQFNIGLSRMARTIRERLSIHDGENLTPSELVNARTISSVINQFFGTNQLSQFMDQTNPLAELTHKRRTSALGPGGLTRERAGFEVRDVHYTHYGRLCPIETPEGPNIGLISSLAIHARVNELGFIETPYRKVVDGMVSDDIEYVSAEQEDGKIIIPASTHVGKGGILNEDKYKARQSGDYVMADKEELDYMDVSTDQLTSVAASLIPFLEHDDANRALMGSNMQRQAVPLLRPHSPIVGTGMEARAANDSRALIHASGAGEVEYVSSEKIIVRYEDQRTDVEKIVDFNFQKKVTYYLTKFFRTNQDTCLNHRPIVKKGDKVVLGSPLVDSASTEMGELALGQNVMVAFMPWRGYNFEDAIILSKLLVAKDVFTSIHIEELSLQVRDTKRGEEEFTCEIPNVSEEATKDLDETGIVRVGALVDEGDILIGKVTPKGETDPTPEEKLDKDFVIRIGKLLDGKKLLGLKLTTGITVFRAGKKVKLEDFIEQFEEGVLYPDKLDLDEYIVDNDEIMDILLRTYHNFMVQRSDKKATFKAERNKLASGDELQPGILQMAKVYVAKKRKLQVGDKMAGRHGNKGIVSNIVDIEDMPFLPDGSPVEIILNPLGVPSRMNLGQLFETALGWAGRELGNHFATSIFDGATWEQVGDYLEKAGLPRSGKSYLFNGRTGVLFDNQVTVGVMYMLKLSHLVADKLHARSIGPYSLITQQPLGGKAQFGGQRLGEMEVWALEAYGASHTLQEMITMKSDDVQGRAKMYETIVKGDNMPNPNIPESFNVLVRELQGLGLDIVID